MEPKNTKALDRVAADHKRKRATQSAVNQDADSQPLRHQPSLTSPAGNAEAGTSKPTNSGAHNGRSLVRYHSNYQKSGRPERLMAYKNGEWLDIPKDVAELVKKDLDVKKESVEVDTNGYHLLIDFLHMCALDLNTGLQQPMAWIDEAGRCFFPQVYAASNEVANELCKEEAGKRNDSREVKLHLNIDLNREWSGESNADTVEGEGNINQRDSGNIGEAIEQPESVNGGELDSDSLQKMLLDGMSSLGGTGVDIVEIYRCSSLLAQARLELFQKQAEITAGFHGDANVRYAWLALPKEEISTMMECGLGHCRLSSSKCPYGIGAHLAAVNCPFASARIRDNDENGMQHLVLCRVIMGNMELLQPGTRQVRPSSSAYDNGVDNIHSPTIYVVWNVHINTHIYPEFVVSFKVSSDGKGPPPGHESKNNASGNNAAGQGCKADNGKAAPTQAPPRLPFPLLLAALRKKIPPKAMEVIEKLYERLLAKQIHRDDFVLKLRMIVGDTLLNATMRSLQFKVPSPGESKDSN